MYYLWSLSNQLTWIPCCRNDGVVDPVVLAFGDGPKPWNPFRKKNRIENSRRTVQWKRNRLTWTWSRLTCPTTTPCVFSCSQLLLAARRRHQHCWTHFGQLVSMATLVQWEPQKLEQLVARSYLKKRSNKINLLDVSRWNQKQTRRGRSYNSLHADCCWIHDCWMLN